MERRSAAQLQKGRRESAKRLFETGLAMLKEAGVKTWTFHEKGLRGRAWPKRSHIVCPKPTTRRRLYILAHECAHIVLNHVRTKPSHRQEYEAESYAHATLRRHGVAVPTKETERAKRYVAYRIDQAIRMGKAHKLDREAVKWCEAELRPATYRALASGSVALMDLSGRERRAKPKRRRTKDEHPNAEATLADQLRAAARQSGLSVNQMAKFTGLDQSGLNRFLNGTRLNIRLDVADRLFRLFRLTVVRTDR